jgi:hypothetical protein
MRLPTYIAQAPISASRRYYAGVGTLSVSRIAPSGRPSSRRPQSLAPKSYSPGQILPRLSWPTAVSSPAGFRTPASRQAVLPRWAGIRNPEHEPPNPHLRHQPEALASGGAGPRRRFVVPGHPASLGLLTPSIAICDNVFGLSNREAVGVEEIGADSARTPSRRRRGRARRFWPGAPPYKAFRSRLDGDRRNAAHAPAIRLQRPSDPAFAVGNLEKIRKYRGLLEISAIGRPLWPLRTCLEPARNLPNAAGGLPATSLEPGHDLPATRRKPALGRLEPAWNLPTPLK